jgi:hypothetical protein
MLNWDDHVKLSKRDVAEARRIALAPFVDEIARAARTIETLEGLSESPERNDLIAKALASRAKWLALKRQREIILEREIPRQSGFVELRVFNLAAALERVDALLSQCRKLPSYGERTLEIVSDVVSSTRGRALAEERLCCLRHTGRRLFFMARLSRQVAASVRASRGRHTAIRSVRPVCSRSAASRSRIVAPTAAPPSEC